MKIRVHKDMIFIMMYTIIMALGNMVNISPISLLHHSFAVIAIAFLLYRKYNPSLIIKICSAYLLYIIIDTFILNQFVINISLLVNYVKIILYIAVIDYELKKNKAGVVDGLYHIILFLCFVNWICMLLFPHGIIQTDVVINEWTTVKRSVWLLGNVNSMIGWYLLLLMLYYYIESSNCNHNIFVLTITSVTALGSILATRSNTSVVVIIISVIGIWIGLLMRRAILFDVKLKFWFIVYVVFAILLVVGQVTFLAPVLEKIFGLDTTFSERSIIWARLLDIMTQNPVFGAGYISSARSVSILGAANMTSAHNQWMQSLWQGGLVGFGLIIAVVATISRKVGLIDNKKNKFVMAVFLFSFLFALLFESVLDRFEMWTLIVLFYYCTMYASSERTREDSAR